MVPTFPQISETFIVSKALGLVDRDWDIRIVCGASPARNWSAFGPTHRVHELRDRVHLSPALDPRPRAVAQALLRLSRLAVDRPRTLLSYLTDNRTTFRQRIRNLVSDVELIRLAPDVVHFEFGGLAPDWIAVRDRLTIASTVSFRGSDIMYGGLNQPDYYRNVWDHADGIHVLGERLWQRALQRGADPDTAHVVIPPAIDASQMFPRAPRPGSLGSETPIRLLSIGRLHWTKGYDDALEAVAKLRSSGIAVEYRIVGDGALLPAVSAWVQELGLDGCVELLRSLPPAEVEHHLGWADIVLHAALSEGFCNAVLEAQAHGVPVVCSDAGGLPENVLDSVTGFVVPRRDPAALADRIIKLAANDRLRARMGAAGRERAARYFRLEDQLEAWARFYIDASRRRNGNSGQPIKECH